MSQAYCWLRQNGSRDGRIPQQRPNGWLCARVAGCKDPTKGSLDYRRVTKLGGKNNKGKYELLSLHDRIDVFKNKDPVLAEKIKAING